MADTPHRWRRAPRSYWRSTLQGALVLGPDSSEPVLLTGPGADIWELLGAGVDETELVSALCERYDVPADVVERDIVPLLEELAETGLAMVDR